MPATVRRSDTQAQQTWVKAHDSALREYGDGARAFQTAWSALERTHEKRGDRWVPKSDHGPSNPPGRGTRGGRRTYGGVDFEGSTKQELYDRARALDVRGRSTMSKSELATAVARAQR